MNNILLAAVACAVFAGPALAESKLCADARAMWSDVKETSSIVALESFAATFEACPVYATLADERLKRVQKQESSHQQIGSEIPSDALSLDEEVCLTLASAPFQHEDFLGVMGRDVMVEPAMEACRAANMAATPLDPEVRAAYARVLSMSGDYEQSFSHASLAASEGSALGMNIIARAYETGRGVEKDRDASLFWYAKAAEMDFPMAQFNLAIEVSEDDPNRALELYERSADLGYGPSQTMLGNVYREGTLAAKNLDTAMRWYERAIEDNQDITAMYWAARMLSGDGGAYPLDYARAVTLYERSADAGNKWSQHNVASLHFHGKGTAPDRDRAAHYWKLAAEQGHVASMRKLGRILQENGAVSEAIYWLQRAAGEGDEVAAELLAKMLDQ